MKTLWHVDRDRLSVEIDCPVARAVIIEAGVFMVFFLFWSLNLFVQHAFAAVKHEDEAVERYGF